ncbi:outer membrane protein assembly factor BamD [Hyphobacterium sp. HN65]|uniref:Outer membrane protein assembly factor BamD n=1 Tax=Hyphobacterium lacteum TaxID=3116575 RepID=A0ABU7LQX3_9PROT|nr:outer membrane protein assembly factor BamD [Hyphobacterium sp. HN65]MEE2526313.1 outer membrane protein assembly factor BamD [Hyphobacterium sp. HN65]
MNFLTRVIFVLLAAALLLGCQSRRISTETVYVEREVETIYAAAIEQMERGSYGNAADQFDEVERQHPYSEWARRAMLMAAYSNYEAGNYEEAISDAERFIALHPGNRSAPYAYYLVAISHFEQILDVGRDQQATMNALNALEQVVRRYPNTRYAQDARLKIDMTRDHLAGKEMSIGRWYLRRGFYLAAINRFRNVLENYETTTHVPEALHRIVESYVALGVDNEATQVASVLGYNFPGSEWYEDTYRLLTEEGIAIPNPDLQPDNPTYWQRLMDRLFG